MSAQLAPTPYPDVWDSEATNEDCVHPLPGREAEYETVLSFVDSRLHTLVHYNSLFVFGACGCGKTSTVLRALRSFTHRSLPSDRQQKKKASPSLSGSQPSSPASTHRRRPRTKETDADDTHAAPLLSSLSQAVKRAKLEVSPGSSSSSSTSAGAGTNGLSLDVSPASSAAHVLSTTGSPQSDGTTSGRSSSHTLSDGRALFLDTSSSTEDMCDEEAEPAVMRYSPDDFASRYGKLYAQRNAPTTTVRGGADALQYVQAHYVNCADLDAQQLADALYSTIKSTTPRPDAASRTLLDALVALPQTARRRAAALRSHSAFSTFTSQSGAAETGPAGKRASSIRKPTLHVIALDEVEYVRGAAARDVLSSLGSLSFSHPTQVALIFISNHRDLVHVPRALLEELPFEPYSIAQLKRIGSAVVQREVGAAAERDAVEAKALAAKTKTRASTRAKGPSRAKPDTMTATACASAQALVQISPTLLEYIARKALLDYSGDVRQVMAMCRRVTFTALEDARTAAMATTAIDAVANKENTAPQGKGHTAKGKAALVAPPPKALPSKLCAAVDAFKGSSSTRSTRPSSTASSTRSSGAHAVTIETAAAAVTQPPARAPHTLTLANTVSLLHGTAVETHVQTHISTMPEQQLYVLCCLVVLTLRHQRDATRASVAIGGAPTSHTRTNANAATASCSVTMRDVHQLYTGLMGLRHFPSMNAAGITTSVDGLADLGIITRPQRRGNEQVFTFNGTWSLDAMQSALENRGEALRSELAACGLDASENKFVTVLRELKNLAGLQLFA